MIDILGRTKIIIIASLAAFNIFLGAVIYLYFAPHNEDLTNQLQSVQHQVTMKRADADRMRNQYETIQEQKAYFGTLKDAGFFTDQNRSIARQRIEQIQKFTNVLTARYNIGSASIEKNPKADSSGYVVINSRGTILFEALDDVDLYNFTYWVENTFPGHVSVTLLDVSRGQDLDDATLRQIGSGTAIPLARGTLNFEWRTMIPASQIANLTKGQP